MRQYSSDEVVSKIKVQLKVEPITERIHPMTGESATENHRNISLRITFYIRCGNAFDRDGKTGSDC